MSDKNGKSQGKSYAAMAVLWLCSCLSTHKVDPTQKQSQIKKFVALTTCPILIEDIANATLFGELVAYRFESKMMYTTNASVSTILPISF